MVALLRLVYSILYKGGGGDASAAVEHIVLAKTEHGISTARAPHESHGEHGESPELDHVEPGVQVVTAPETEKTHLP